MMKKNLKQMQSFITFDLPFNTQHIGSLFTNTHYNHLTSIPNWSSSATRKKVIAKYWFEYVLIHFATLIGISVIVAIPFINSIDISFLPSLWMVATISFFVLLVINYWPSYYSNFLPKLESLVDDFEKQQTSKLHEKSLARLHANLAIEYEQIARQREELASQREQLAAQRDELAKEKEQLGAALQEQVKCRKEQLPTFSLALIFYVLDKASGMNSLQCNDQSASSLAKVIGKDPTGIKKSLQLITAKQQDLSVRLRTEISNHFDSAYQFFHEHNYKEGTRLLQSLESKFKQKHKQPADGNN
jgi:Membrane-bound metallopeptidase